MATEIPTERVKFIADDNLLRQVITDQAGDWKKGILELIQNAYDGLVMKDSITAQTYISIHAKTENGVSTLVVEDNGCGWGKDRDEVIRNMKVFGNSLKKEIENTIGEKGMGRGQAFAMIYDMAKNEFVGDIVIETQGWKIFDIKLNDLSFTIEKAKKVGDTPIKWAGTKWTITSTYRMFNENEIYDFVQENILLPVTIKLNGNAIPKDVKGKRFETDKATYIINQGKGGFKLYDRGLYVKFEKLGGIGGHIITKIPLTLNFARNDVLSSDPDYDEIVRKSYDFVAEYINETNGKFNDEKRVAVKSLMAKDSKFLYQFYNYEVIKTAQGKFISPAQLEGMGKVYLAEEGNRLADDICQMGGIVIADGYGELAKRCGVMVENVDSSTDSIVERAKSNRYQTYGDFDDAISERMRECIAYIRELGIERQLLFGNHKSWIAWTNGSDSIWFSTNHFKKWAKAKTRAGFYMKSLPTIAHEMAHESDNRETDYHGYGFDERHIEILEKLKNKASGILDKENA